MPSYTYICWYHPIVSLMGQICRLYSGRFSLPGSIHRRYMMLPNTTHHHRLYGTRRVSDSLFRFSRCSCNMVVVVSLLITLLPRPSQEGYLFLEVSQIWFLGPSERQAHIDSTYILTFRSMKAKKNRVKQNVPKLPCTANKHAQILFWRF